MNILFLVTSSKLYERRVLVSTEDLLKQHGSVKIIETAHRTDPPPSEEDGQSRESDSSEESRRGTKQSGVTFKRAVSVAAGFYLNPQDGQDDQIGTLHDYFLHEIRSADCVVADLNMRCPQMGFLIAQAFAETIPVLCVYQHLAHFERERFEYFKSLDGIMVAEFASEEELRTIFQQFILRASISRAG